MESWQPSMSKNGQVFDFNKANNAGTWEFQLVEKVPELMHLHEAVAKLLGDQQPAVSITASVELKATLGLPRVEGIVDVIRGHPAITERKANCLTLCDVAFRSVLVQSYGQEEDEISYGQVFALGSAQGIDFVFVRAYAPAIVDNGRCLTFQPLVWEQPSRDGNKKQRRSKVCTVPGSYWALSTDMLLRRVCIAPNYALGDGHFLLNDLVDQM